MMRQGLWVGIVLLCCCGDSNDEASKKREALEKAAARLEAATSEMEALQKQQAERDAKLRKISEALNRIEGEVAAANVALSLAQTEDERKAARAQLEAAEARKGALRVEIYRAQSELGGGPR